jgi:plasmid stabilization system protein ParE
MSNAARRDLHDLVDALPPGEVQAARRYLELLVAVSDPLSGLPDDERARLHASLREAEVEIAAGQAVAADVVLRELQASR